VPTGYFHQGPCKSIAHQKEKKKSSLPLHSHQALPKQEKPCARRGPLWPICKGRVWLQSFFELAFKDDESIVCVLDETKVGLHGVVHCRWGLCVVMVTRIKRQDADTAQVKKCVLQWGLSPFRFGLLVFVKGGGERESLSLDLRGSTKVRERDGERKKDRPGAQGSERVLL
jgi:hypothetical protein